MFPKPKGKKVSPLSVGLNLMNPDREPSVPKEDTLLGWFQHPHMGPQGPVSLNCYKLLWKWMQNLCACIHTYHTGKTLVERWRQKPDLDTDVAFLSFVGTKAPSHSARAVTQSVILGQWRNNPSFHIVGKGSGPQFWSSVLPSLFSASCGGCRRGTPETWIWRRLAGNRFWLS